jgi:glycosyltransferase involved in cell wall biosynthesis
MSRFRTKHILHLIHGLTIGGAEVDLLHKCRYLVQHYNYDMTICCLMRRGELAPQFEALGIRVNGPLMCHRYDIRAGRQLRKLMAEPQWDLVHTHLSAATRFAWFVNLSLLRQRKRLIASEHAMAERWHPLVIGLKRLMMCTGVKLLVPSEAARESYVARGVPRCALVVLANGVDTQQMRHLNYDQLRTSTRQALGVREDEFLIGTVCRLERVKNLPLLFAATSALPVQVIVIGDGSQRQNLEQLIVTRGWTDRIHLLGSKMNIPQWLAAFDLFVLPSSSESFGIAVAESLLMQTPVVATRVGGIPEISGDGAYATLVTPSNQQALQEAICWSMQHYTQAKAMARQGKEYIEKTFSIAASAAQLHQIYEEVSAGEKASLFSPTG